MWFAVTKFVNIKTEYSYKRNRMTIPNSSTWITTRLDYKSRFLEMYPALSLFMVSKWPQPTFVFWQHYDSAWKKGKSREHSGAPYHHTTTHICYTVCMIPRNFTVSPEWFSSVTKSWKAQGPDILPIFMLTDDKLMYAFLQDCYCSYSKGTEESL